MFEKKQVGEKRSQQKYEPLNDKARGLIGTGKAIKGNGKYLLQKKGLGWERSKKTTTEGELKRAREFQMKKP